MPRALGRLRISVFPASGEVPPKSSRRAVALPVGPLRLSVVLVALLSALTLGTTFLGASLAPFNTEMLGTPEGNSKATRLSFVRQAPSILR